MSYKVYICPKEKLTFVMLSGEVTLSGIQKTAEALVAHPSYKASHDELIWYLPNTSLANMQLEDYERMLNILKNTLSYDPTDVSKTAIISATGPNHQTLRLLKAISIKDLQYTRITEIFDSLDAACKWLGKDAAIMAAIYTKAYQSAEKNYIADYNHLENTIIENYNTEKISMPN